MFISPAEADAGDAIQDAGPDAEDGGVAPPPASHQPPWVALRTHLTPGQQWTQPLAQLLVSLM